MTHQLKFDSLPVATLASGKFKLKVDPALLDTHLALLDTASATVPVAGERRSESESHWLTGTLQLEVETTRPSLTLRLAPSP